MQCLIPHCIGNINPEGTQKSHSLKVKKNNVYAAGRGEKLVQSPTGQGEGRNLLCEEAEWPVVRSRDTGDIA